MKKNLLKLATAGLFAGALLLSISAVPGGKVSLIKKAQAENSGIRKTYIIPCDDGTGRSIILCGVGASSCSPLGNCD